MTSRLYSLLQVKLMLLALLVLFGPVNGAVHGHPHRHLVKKVNPEPATAPVSLAASTAIGFGSATILQGTATPCTGASCEPAITGSSERCPDGNQTAWADFADSRNYNMICDIDFPSVHNIYPFVSAESFEGCMTQCESYNSKMQLRNNNDRCEGFVFAPERLFSGDNCYLKSSVTGPIPATISLVGATTISLFATTVTPLAMMADTKTSKAMSSTTSSSSAFTTPKVVRSKLHGPSVNDPTNQWVYHEPATPVKLESNLLVPGANSKLISQFDIAGDTGPLKSNTSPFRDPLANLSVTPHLSRDGGKGGELDGRQIFYFCDTASFTTTDETHQGEMVSFTSSSVAVDDGLKGASGEPLVLVDGIGQWNDDVGRMRGFSPMTTGEHSFNIALSGDGYRYAVWPESSIISLNKTHALQYASLVYDEVNMSNQHAKFTSLGNTLLTISVDADYGPTAERTVKHLFHQGEVAWGSIGGIRSWGSDGVGGTDGKVYVFGKAADGVLVARVKAALAADRDSYEYWSGDGWTSGQLPLTATTFLVKQSVMDFDLFYSPHHKTFIMVYLSPLVDNIFYYRYLRPSGPIDAPSSGGSNVSPDYDYVEEILKHPWSDEQILYKADAPSSGEYIYAGSVHTGYFGDEDITKGGTKLLLSWTQNTGKDAASPSSGYAHMTASVEFG